MPQGISALVATFQYTPPPRSAHLASTQPLDPTIKHGRGPAAGATPPPPAKTRNDKKQKTEGTGLKRADGTPWEPITGTVVPIVGGKEGLKQEWCGAAASASFSPDSRRLRPRAGR